MQIKTIGYHLTPIRMTTIIKSLQTISVHEVLPASSPASWMPQLLPQPHSSHYLWPSCLLSQQQWKKRNLSYFDLQISLAFSVLAGSTDSPRPLVVAAGHPSGNRVFSYQVQWQLLINKLMVTLDYSLNYLTLTVDQCQVLKMLASRYHAARLLLFLLPLIARLPCDSLFSRLLKFICRLTSWALFLSPSPQSPEVILFTFRVRTAGLKEVVWSVQSHPMRQHWRVVFNKNPLCARHCVVCWGYRFK